jgi:hypothetical protein
MLHDFHGVDGVALSSAVDIARRRSADPRDGSHRARLELFHRSAEALREVADSLLRPACCVPVAELVEASGATCARHIAARFASDAAGSVVFTAEMPVGHIGTERAWRRPRPAPQTMSSPSSRPGQRVVGRNRPPARPARLV